MDETPTQNTDRTPDVLDIRGAAEYLRVSERTIARMRSAGRIRSFTVGKRPRFRKDWLLEDVSRTGKGEG